MAADTLTRLEENVVSIQRQVDEMKADIRRLREEFDDRHGDNSERLTSIEVSQAKILNTISIASFAMNLAWGLGGSIVGGLIAGGHRFFF